MVRRRRVLRPIRTSDEDFDEYDKPGAERFRRRRGEDDLQSDLEEELLEDDWFSGKKPSEASDEELNDDLLQSDDDDVNMSGQDVSLNATYSLGRSYVQDNSQEANYTDAGVNLGAEGYEEGDVEEEEYQQEEYTEEYGHHDNAEMPEDQMDYTGELAEGEDGYQDVIDIQINEPLDGEFQDNEDQTSYDDEHGVQQGVAPEEEEEEDVPMGGEEQQEEEEAAETSQVFDTEVENEALPEEETKEESDEEDEEDEESGRLRFKSERKDGVVVRLADAGNNRRNIPETLELSEKAKQDLREFEEQERQKRQNRYGGRGGRIGGGGRGGRGRGGFPSFGMGDFRGGHRGRMNDNRIPLMGNMGMQQQSSRMPPPHQQHLQSQQHHPSRPRGPPPFQDLGRPLAQQPLQPLIPPHMSHRSPSLRPQMEPPPRMMSSPPPNFPQHHQQPPQPKNIHINPHFRGPTSSSVQVPLMPPAQSQPRPAVGPQRFPGPGDFQQRMPDNFGQPHRPPHHMEPYRNQPPQGPPDREPLFMPERAESTRFPGPHMFDHPGPSPLINSNIHQQQQLPGPGHMGFGPPGPAFNQPGQGPLGLFPREPPRPNHPPHQGHQGMIGMNQQDGLPNPARPFISPRQPFGQQGNLFSSPPVQFGMQVRLRGLMHGPPVSQLPHHDSLSPHQSMHHHQQHHRQELPHHHHPHHHHQQQLNLGEPRPMMHHGQNPFHQQQGHGSPRQMTPRPQNPQQRIMSNKQRMNTPLSKQMQPRNSNLRELPVAPGNTSMNTAHPLSSPAARPVAKATQGVRPGQNIQPVPDHGRGRGQVVAKTKLQPGGVGRTVVRKEIPSTPSSTEPQDPNEDEETRQYRLKIEEQKRLREEILKRKEMRRQMQAGVRKKELLDRLNSQAPNTQSQGPTSPIHPAPQNQQTPHPVQQQQQQQQQQPPEFKQQPEFKQHQQQQLQPQLQRPFPQRPQQSINQPLKNPNQETPIPPNGAAQTVTPRPNVKARLQMVKGGTPLSQIPGPGPQQNQLQQQQQRTSAVQNINKPITQVQKNIPVIPLAGPGHAQVQSQEPKPGAKRTVMQRAKNSGIDSQPVPQKVRVFKLSGATGKGPVASGVPVQQQDTCAAAAVNQGIQRKVTMAGQPLQGPGGTPQACRGGMGNPQQNRVVVSGRGRGRGGGQMGRGRPVSTRQSPRLAESQRCTVSIEGLSSSTTEAQLRNLLRSIGPIQMFNMMPQQRKAVAKFSSPEHAANFQMSFHRHMIDLSHIDVSLIDG